MNESIRKIGQLTCALDEFPVQISRDVDASGVSGCRNCQVDRGKEHTGFLYIKLLFAQSLAQLCPVTSLDSREAKIKGAIDRMPDKFLNSDEGHPYYCLLYTSPSPRDQRGSRMPSSA